MKYFLGLSEAAAIRSLTAHIDASFESSESDDFVREIVCFAHELPRGLRQFLEEFRASGEAGYCGISGFLVEDDKLGVTPATWNTDPETSKAKREEIFLMLTGALIGDVFTFKSHAQGSRIVHNVLPIRGYEGTQLAFSSSDELLWHTEDAFHAFRADYLGLMCLRNDDLVPTTVLSLSDLCLSGDLKDFLFERRFLLRPDDTHRLDPREEAHEALVPILFGNPSHPFISIDPIFMKGADREAENVLKALISEISSQMRSLILRPGDICLIDNYRAVHGRKPFVARFDGRDRWLKRIYLTRDLRKSSHGRALPRDRVIHSVR
jgi:Fe(II)/alpha-ketoglutarate-dependent arginine beta-hydroxylase